jgi:hypothetical protein
LEWRHGVLVLVLATVTASALASLIPRRRRHAAPAAIVWHPGEP